MKTTVVGVYNSSFETILAIEDLRKSGLETEQMIVVGKDPFATSLVHDKTSVKVERDLMDAEEEKTGFWMDLMAKFRGKKSNQNQPSNGLGLSKEDLEHYNHLLATGKILVFATEPPSFIDGDGVIIPSAMMESSNNEMHT